MRLTSNVQFVTHDGSMWVLRKKGMVKDDANLYGKISIGNNVNIGWNTVIMPGVTIEDDCIIGLGSVVTKDVPKGMVVAGTPAKVICSIDEYKRKHENQFIYINNTKGREKEKIILSYFEKKN